jgi:hypothetical protein
LLARRVRDRVILQGATTRKLLRCYAREEELDGEAVSLQQILDDCEAGDAKWLREIVTAIRAKDSDNEHACPQQLRRLLTAVSMATPVSGFVLDGPRMEPLLARMSAGLQVRSDAEALSLLTDNCPCLVDLMLTEWWPGSGAPDWLRPLLLHLSETVNNFVNSELGLFYRRRIR